MSSNSAELFITNRVTLHSVGESIANGPTAQSVELARANVRHAKRLLAKIEEEHAEARKTEKRRERDRTRAWLPELATA
ncbi:hypothetical protein NUJ30_08230 [Burkholderia contaminans]|uniref:hypothetical protein n=1 Tax=Burkholderia TaxID=32008 RepID=UPI0010F4EA43|nr:MULTISPECIES: hypothetical protein [Burkholderia]MBD1412898.1 hypothetical protein [Burkholderia contaminans]UXZ68653.1 hypothetical protein NUJ29_08235 [Burkholderia contaminans]UXZ76414.1 hypothetical protein NUJ30_08230 [Burkholderia contaminans]